jgi:hypothetical protein
MTERKKISHLFKKLEQRSQYLADVLHYPTAYLQEQAGVEMILVRHLGMTMLATTRPCRSRGRHDPPRRAAAARTVFWSAYALYVTSRVMRLP